MLLKEVLLASGKLYRMQQLVELTYSFLTP